MKLLTGSCQGANDLCTALGLRGHETVAFELKVRSGEVATLTVEQFVLENFAKGLANELKRYKLVEIEQGPVPRYVLPAELAPGIPWPLGFKEDTDKWSRSFLGYKNS